MGRTHQAEKEQQRYRHRDRLQKGELLGIART